jgi:hypothetical protein
MVALPSTRMVYFAIALLYNVFKSHTIAMLASVVGGCTVVVMFISWFLWTGKIRQLTKFAFPV